MCHCILNSDVSSQGLSQVSENGCPKLAIAKFVGAILFKGDFEKNVGGVRGDFLVFWRMAKMMREKAEYLRKPTTESPTTFIHTQ